MQGIFSKASKSAKNLFGEEDSPITKKLYRPHAKTDVRLYKELKNMNELKLVDLSGGIDSKMEILETLELVETCMNNISQKTKYHKCEKFSKTAQGVVYKICDDKNAVIGILKSLKYDGQNEILKRGVVVSETLAEVIISGLLNILYENDIIPNVVYTSKAYICHKCIDHDIGKSEGEDTLVTSYVAGKCIYTLTEYINGGTINENKYWLSKSPKLLKTILFQVLITLYALQTQFGIAHCDLHTGNIMLDKLNYKNDEYITYEVNGKKYQVPANMIVKIIDFGRGFIEGKIEPEVILKNKADTVVIDVYGIPIYSKPIDKSDQRRMAFNILSKLLDIQILKVKGDEDNEWGRYSADGFAFADEKSFNEYINEKMLEIIRSNSYHDTEYNDVLNILRLCLNGTPLKDIIETQFKDMREKEGRKEVYRYYVDGKITQVTSNGKKLLKFANAMGKAYGNPDVDPFKSVNVIDKEMIMSTREITPEMKFQLV